MFILGIGIRVLCLMVNMCLLGLEVFIISGKLYLEVYRLLILIVIYFFFINVNNMVLLIKEVESILV